MKPIIPRIDRRLIKQELTRACFVRKTNNGSNDIYIVTIHDAPNTLREIGRLREVTFRYAGGGTGLDCDLDEYDYGDVPYKQLIVWSPQEEEIIGGYRFIACRDAVQNGCVRLATARLFNFSPTFVKEYLPYTIELGRSFVQPRYQPSAHNRKGLFSLDNLWDGLGAIVVDNPHIRYFFGKVTMYRHYQPLARDLILAFMNHYFPDPDHLVWPIHPLPVVHDVSDFIKSLDDLPYKEGHHLLNQQVRNLGENIPPLFNSYMNLSATMKTFGTALNPHFGEVEETGIMVTINDIYPSKKERHINSYLKEKAGRNLF
jgi:hypothetical protein